MLEISKPIKCCLILLLLSTIIYSLGFGFGLQYDTVLRANNVIPLINRNAYPLDQSIFSISVFGTTIPIVYKEYITPLSSMAKYSSLVFFNDYYFGFKVINLAYLLVSVSLSFAALSLYKNTKYAFLVCLCVIFFPMNYPMLLFDQLNWDCFIWISIAYIVFTKYKSSGNLWLLFLASLFFFITINWKFYSIFLILSIIIVSFLYKMIGFRITKQRIQETIILFIGAIVGCINYVLYNVLNGFPTLSIFFNSIFNRSSYTPIDDAIKTDFLSEVKTHVEAFISFIGNELFVFSVLLVAVSLLLLVFAISKRAYGVVIHYYLLFVSLLAFLIAFIAPSADRPDHYIQIIPFFVMGIIDALSIADCLFGEFIQTKIKKYLVSTLCVISIGLLIVPCYRIISSNYKTKGSGHFSPSIFELFSYIDNDYHEDVQYIDNKKDKKIAVFGWGIGSQLYFLSKGEFLLDERYKFELMDADETYENTYNKLLQFFLSDTSECSTIYIPTYTKRLQLFDPNIGQAIEALAAKTNTSFDKLFFNERNASDIIALYVIDDYMGFRYRTIEKSFDFKKAFPENYGTNQNGYIWIEFSSKPSNSIVVKCPSGPRTPVISGNIITVDPGIVENGTILLVYDLERELEYSITYSIPDIMQENVQTILESFEYTQTMIERAGTNEQGYVWMILDHTPLLISDLILYAEDNRRIDIASDLSGEKAIITFALVSNQNKNNTQNLILADSRKQVYTRIKLENGEVIFGY